MDLKKIKKTESELKRISKMKLDLQNYVDSTLKNTLLKSCELCETVLKIELERLRASVPQKKTRRSRYAQFFDNKSRMEIEELAFDIHTPEPLAKAALSELMKIVAG